MQPQTDGPNPNISADIRQVENVRIFIVTGISIAVIALLALLYPAPLALPVFSTLTSWAAFGSILAAALMSQRMFTSHLNMWDKALFLLFASFAAGLFVDQKEVVAFLEAANSGSANTVQPAPAASPNS